MRALIEILAGIHGHELDVRVSAGRARQDGLENELDHTRRHFGSDLRDAQAPSFVESGSRPGTYPLGDGGNARTNRRFPIVNMTADHNYFAPPIP